MSSKKVVVSKNKNSKKKGSKSESKVLIDDGLDFESVKKLVLDKLSGYDSKKVKSILDKLSSDIEILIKVYPIQSVLIAIVIGLIIGRLTKRK